MDRRLAIILVVVSLTLYLQCLPITEALTGHGSSGRHYRRRYGKRNMKNIEVSTVHGQLNAASLKLCILCSLKRISGQNDFKLV